MRGDDVKVDVMAVRHALVCQQGREWDPDSGWREGSLCRVD